MRVLMLSKACIVGTYQRKLEEIARFPDIALRVVVPPYWKDERGKTKLERAYVQGYELCVTPMRFNGNFHLHYYPSFRQHVLDFRPDVLHIDEEPYNLATWLALRAARNSGAKTLFFSWQNILRHYPPPFSWIERATFTKVDYAIMGTASAAEVWQQKGYIGKIALIPQFGVDPDIFYPPPHRSDDSSVNIGYAGRLVPEKGVDLLIEALSRIKKEMAWRLEIIGSGPEKATLMTQVKSLGLEERVHWREWVPSVEMPEVYRTLDILAMPSRTRPNWKEQFGRVLIEAMASEVAVIGSNSGAIPDVIGTSGLIFPEDDVQALADGLKDLVENKNKRQAFAQQGRRRVLELFTQQQVAAQTVDVYRSLLQS